MNNKKCNLDVFIEAFETGDFTKFRSIPNNHLQANDFDYEFSDKSGHCIRFIIHSEQDEVEIVDIISKDNCDPTLQVPSSVIINGVAYSISSIGQNAFADNKFLTEVILPNSIRQIGIGAFRDCSNLASVLLPENLTILEDSVFCGCSELKHITFPVDLSQIKEFAFYNCKSLESVTLPDTVLSIGNNTFSSCFALKTIYLSTNLEFIGKQCFHLSNSLTQILVSKNNSTFSIEDGVLYNNEKSEIVLCIPTTVGEVNIHNGCKRIAEYAFANCKNVNTVTMPNTVSYVGDYAFCNCGMKSIVLSSRLKTIRECVFAQCPNLDTVDLSRITGIGEYAFSSSNIKSISISEKTTSIAQSAFIACNNLTNLTVSPNNPKYCSINSFLLSKNLSILFPSHGGEANEINVPEGTGNIWNYCFHGLKQIKKITIPNSVSNIAKEAISQCDNLEDIFLGNGLQSIDDQDIGYNSNKIRMHFMSIRPPYCKISSYSLGNLTLFVPKGTENEYRKAGWNGAEIIAE